MALKTLTSFIEGWEPSTYEHVAKCASRAFGLLTSVASCADVTTTSGSRANGFGPSKAAAARLIFGTKPEVLDATMVGSAEEALSKAAAPPVHEKGVWPGGTEPAMSSPVHENGV